MNFGFITTVLKNIGKAALPVAEEAGVAPPGWFDD